MVWYGMVWYGMVMLNTKTTASLTCRIFLEELRSYPLNPLWYGMVWYGMVWYGMIWYGNVQ